MMQVRMVTLPRLPTLPSNFIGVNRVVKRSFDSKPLKKYSQKRPKTDSGEDYQNYQIKAICSVIDSIRQLMVKKVKI